MARTRTIRTAAELAQYLGAMLAGDPESAISGVASPERAGSGDLIYVTSPRHAERAAASASGCAIVPSGMRLAGKTVIEAVDPKFAFAKAAAWLAPSAMPKPGIHPTAIVPGTTRLGESVSIGPYVVIEDDVEIGEGSVIEAFCALGRGAIVGDFAWFHPHVTLYAGARLGDRVEVHSGAVIGADGFGYVFGEERYWKFPQQGSVEIGDDAEIGANTTIDRGSLDITRVGAGAKLDNLVQIGHNVQIGEHTVIAAQVGISGSSYIGRRVMLGGQAGLGEHCIVEDEAVVGGQSGVLNGKTIRSRRVVWGTPARSLDRFKEQFAWLGRLPELAERLRRLEESRKGD